MAFGFAGAAAAGAESLDQLLTKRRAEALAQQELQQRQVTEERMRQVSEQQMAESRATMAANAQEIGRRNAMYDLSQLSASEPVPEELQGRARQFNLGLRTVEELPSSQRIQNIAQGLPVVPLTSVQPKKVTYRMVPQAEMMVNEEIDRKRQARAVFLDRNSTEQQRRVAGIDLGLKPIEDVSEYQKGQDVIANQLKRYALNISAQETEAGRVPRRVQEQIHEYIGKNFTAAQVAQKIFRANPGVNGVPVVQYINRLFPVSREGSLPDPPDESTDESTDASTGASTGAKAPLPSLKMSNADKTAWLKANPMTRPPWYFTETNRQSPNAPPGWTQIPQRP